MSTLGDFEFESTQFVNFVQPTFSALFVLLKESKECDTKMSVLNVMSFVVDKMGDNLMKDAESLCRYLPMLWNESQDHNMLRCAILAALVCTTDIPSKVYRIRCSYWVHCIQCFFKDEIYIFDVSLLVANHCDDIGGSAVFANIFVPRYCVEHE